MNRQREVSKREGFRPLVRCTSNILSRRELHALQFRWVFLTSQLSMDWSSFDANRETLSAQTSPNFQNSRTINDLCPKYARKVCWAGVGKNVADHSSRIPASELPEPGTQT